MGSRGVNLQDHKLGLNFSCLSGSLASFDKVSTMHAQQVLRLSRLPLSLAPLHQCSLTLIAFFLVAFGQPAWLPWNGLIASALGFALFWRVLLAYPLAKHRFCLATTWLCAVELVQLSWFISHPYWYIYTVYLLLAIGIGLQFGVLAIFIHIEKFAHSGAARTFFAFLPITASWTLLEWSRLFVLSGFSWNPVGIALTGNLYALQAASLAGVFGLSFWVILVNLFALWAWIQKKAFATFIWMLAVALPYCYGFAQVSFQDTKGVASNLNALLVQTAFAPEEFQGAMRQTSLIQHVIGEWGKILQATKKHLGKPIHLIALPEFVVPYGTYSDVYKLLDVKKTFYNVLGQESLRSLPPLEFPLASLQKTAEGPEWLVNNAYWAQALANYFQADLVIGLEDAEDLYPSNREYYSSAIFIHPQKKEKDFTFSAKRYCKRILVPLGEYIPFDACKKLAEQYGIFGSFTSGKEAVLMHSSGIAFSPSICYEETFGDIMREGRQKGAHLFVNLTSDVWYPNSKLPKQHLDHARLRTVENGVPLIRACNTGITAAIDSLGRTLAVLGGQHPEQVEWIADSLFVTVPLHSYQTLYSCYGDFLIIAPSILILCVFILCLLYKLKF